MRKIINQASKIIEISLKSENRELWKKLLGITLIVLGMISAKLSGDGTAMIMLMFIGTAAILG